LPLLTQSTDFRKTSIEGDEKLASQGYTRTSSSHAYRIDAEEEMWVSWMMLGDRGACVKRGGRMMRRADSPAAGHVRPVLCW